MMANQLKLCEVHSCFTSPKSCQCTTVLCYLHLLYVCVQVMASSVPLLFVCALPEKAIPEMTSIVSGRMLNPTHSLTH